MRENGKSFKIPHTMMDADIPLVWSGLMAKLVYGQLFLGISSVEILWTPSWKYPNLEEQYSTTVRDDLSKGYIVEIDLF